MKFKKEENLLEQRILKMEEDWNKIILWDNIFSFVSLAIIVSSICIVFLYLEDDFGLTLTGWMMSLFWVLYSKTWRKLATHFKQGKLEISNILLKLTKKK